MGRRRIPPPGKHLQWIGAVVVLVILATMGLFLVVGTPVVSAKDVQTVVALTSAGVNANATNINEEDGWLTFSLGVDAAILKITFEEDWGDVKGSFTHLLIDLSKLEFSAIWKYCKVYLSDGTTEIYIGSISYDDYEKEYKFEIETSDIKTLDDLKGAMVVLKFYDQNGNLVDCIDSTVVEQEIKCDFIITSEEGTITSYFIAAFMAFIAALRKVVQGLTAGLTSFLIAVTTNSALLVIFGFIGIMFLWWFFTSGKKEIQEMASRH